MLYYLHVCVGASSSTTTYDDPSSIGLVQQAVRLCSGIGLVHQVVRVWLQRLCSGIGLVQQVVRVWL
jgi:hypothetical protein